MPSYFSGGTWDLSTQPQIDCQKHFLCTPGHRTWHPKRPLRRYDNVTACNALRSKGIRTIFFHGDSYMRHVYAAILITLNGDYKYGSITNSTNAPYCSFQTQFYERKCGRLTLKMDAEVCDGQVLLDPWLNHLHGLDHAKANRSVVLFSFGNHKTQPGAPFRHGVNNASAFSEFFVESTCPGFRKAQRDPHNNASVWWVSTHARLVAHFEDERAETVRSFNEEMRAFAESGRCGDVGYIDVYNATEALANLEVRSPGEAKALTFDSVHWGLEANLVKAQIILNALLE